MIGAVITGVVELASQWFTNKREKNQAKHERDLTRIANQATWEQTQAENAKSSWKDEWFTLVLSVPLIGAFIPPLVPYVQQGFIVLNGMPDYYKAFLGAAMGAAFGYKTLKDFWLNKK